MKVGSRIVVMALCLSLAALVAACGTGSAGGASPAPKAKALTGDEQAQAYLDALGPIVQADKRAWAKMEKMESGVQTNAYSVAARIDSHYLPVIEHIQARADALKPPHRFGRAHLRLKTALTAQHGLLSFFRDGLNDAIYTHTVQPGFLAALNRRIARVETTMRQFDKAVRRAARGLDLKVPQRLAAAAGARRLA